jgi:hypothetical protein
LEETHSVKSIRERPGKGKKYGGSPGAPTFQVGGDKTQEQDSIEINSDDKDKESDLAALSRDKLIARLHKASISGKPKGSAPTSKNNKSHSNSEEEDIMSTDSYDRSGTISGSSSGSSAELTNKPKGRANSG